MTTFLVTLGVLLTVVCIMAVGVIFSNKVLQGSCGGLGRVLGEDCMICGKKEECEKMTEEELAEQKAECAREQLAKSQN